MTDETALEVVVEIDVGNGGLGDAVGDVEETVVASDTLDTPILRFYCMVKNTY